MATVEQSCCCSQLSKYVLNTPSSHHESANPGSTDNGLLDGIRARDEQAWTRFVDEYSPLIYVWCRKCDLQSADARDVSQQVFHTVSRSIATFSKSSGKGSFRGWLFTITRNLIRNHLTRTLRGPRSQGGTSIQLRLLEEPAAIDKESLSAAISSTQPTTIQTILDSARTEFDDRVPGLVQLAAQEPPKANATKAEIVSISTVMPNDEFRPLILPTRTYATGQFGVSEPPCKKWTWRLTNLQFGHPNLILLNDERIISTVFIDGDEPHSALCQVDALTGKLTELLRLPTGDTAQPIGMTEHDGHIWVSFHDGPQDSENPPTLKVAKIKLQK
jgi:RNA polymerase sigma factor (sigma-70 family)